MVLAEIERQKKQPACELFDLIAGTSAGGIIALGVTAPGQGGKPLHSAEELAGFFVEDGPQIFSSCLLRTLKTFGGLLEQKYSASGLEAALQHNLGDALLSEALCDVLITSYDVQSHDPLFFKSRQARKRPDRDYPMRVVARATSAAPTYFEPEHVIPPVHVSGKPRDYALVDGGTFANNPAMCAYAEAKRHDPETDILVVSLGTGRLAESIPFRKAKHWGLVEWARPLLGVIMDGSSAAIDYQLNQVLGRDVLHYRFQTELKGVSDSLDDVSKDNIEGLSKLAKELIKESAKSIAAVCKLL